MIAETNLNDAIKFLKAKLTALLNDDLGQYEVMSGATIKATIPSIWVEPPNLPSNYRLKRKSNDTTNPLYLEGMGIECIISRDGDIGIEPLIGAKQVNRDFKIVLRQWDYKDKSLQVPALKVINGKWWEIEKNLIVQPFIETSQGFSYPQGIISIRVSSYDKFSG